MSGVLVVAEARRGELRPISAELVAAARELGDAGAGEVTVLLVAAGASELAAAAGLGGADRVLAVESPCEHFEAHIAERALEAAIERQLPGGRPRRPDDRLDRLPRRGRGPRRPRLRRRRQAARLG